MERLSRNDQLFHLLVTSFCVIVILSNLITAKLFRAPFIPDLPLPAGLITYPFTFLLCDLVTELYGARRAKFMVFLGFFMSLLGLLLIQISILLPPFNQDNQRQIEEVFGINGIVVFGSMLAYAVTQVIDIQLFARIKKFTKERHLWLRNNVSTLVSQLIDTCIVNVFIFYLGYSLGWDQIFWITLYAYLYKAFFSVIDTPLFYLLVSVCRRSLAPYPKMS